VSENKAPHILNLSTRWGCVVGITSQQLYSPEKEKETNLLYKNTFQF